MSEKLRNCPFCGGTNVVVKSYNAWRKMVKCQDCSCGTEPNLNIREAEAIAAWNTRATDGLVSKLVGALEKTIKHIDHDAVQAIGEWQTGMCCGLEDRGIVDM